MLPHTGRGGGRLHCEWYVWNVEKAAGLDSTKTPLLTTMMTTHTHTHTHTEACAEFSPCVCVCVCVCVFDSLPPNMSHVIHCSIDLGVVLSYLSLTHTHTHTHTDTHRHTQTLFLTLTHTIFLCFLVSFGGMALQSCDGIIM